VVRPVSICVRTDNLLFLPDEFILSESRSAPIDLSKATKLKDVVFRPGPLRVEWVVRALQTITPEHRNLQQITIHIPYYLTIVRDFADIRQVIGIAQYGVWWDLDRLLVQLWESRSIRPKVICAMDPGVGGVELFLPEITKRKIIDFVGR
jgi:hypothetical protein